MAISLTVSGGSPISNIPYTTGMNVQQALEAAYNTFSNPPNIPTINYWLEYFGSSQGQYLGYMVNMMDGTVQQGSKYWILYVNSVVATTGIDQTILKDGDKVDFRYEAYSEQAHGHTVMKLVQASK